jgi:hypothetical protein
MGFPKRKFLMAYISRSGDLSQRWDFQKRKFDGLCKQYFLCQKIQKNPKKIIKITKKGNFDGLHNKF